MVTSRVLSISGIDTGIGKTIATGLLARSCLEHGIKTITQKIVQTGCTGLSEDIVRHREIMEIELQPVDFNGQTCPYVFPVPCSPHLAARLENKKIDLSVIRRATAALQAHFDLVLLEGAGGLFVPLNEDETLLDYFAAEQYPLILVSSSRLGSINHTLSALALAKSRNIDVAAILYNHFEDTDPRIEQDSRKLIAGYMTKFGYTGPVIDLFPLERYQNADAKIIFWDMCKKFLF